MCLTVSRAELLNYHVTTALGCECELCPVCVADPEADVEIVQVYTRALVTTQTDTHDTLTAVPYSVRPYIWASYASVR